MKTTFKQLLIQQLKAIGKYDIEEDSETSLYVWDNEDLHGTHYNFDTEGNLTDIF